jgi:hypothetical protein
MGRKAITASELIERAQANGYIYGAHRDEDSTRSIIQYTKKTIRDQDRVLKLYET